MRAPFLAHEPDASAREEWRMLPRIPSLPGGSSRDAFGALHAPLAFAPLLSGSGARERVAAVEPSDFAIVHGLLPGLPRNHPADGMNDRISPTATAPRGPAGAARPAPAATNAGDA